jgi:RNA polymerase sigma-70 factor (ECF subfamily)
MESVLGAHFFRHEYGRLVALLSRRVGAHHLEPVEDSVQTRLAMKLSAATGTATPADGV